MPLAYRHVADAYNVKLNKLFKIKELNRETFDLFLPNDLTIITGQNGCGKTTLCNAIANMYNITNYAHHRSGMHRGEDTILATCFNARGAGETCARGNANYANRLADLKECGVSEGESMLLSLINFCTETLLYAKLLVDVSDLTLELHPDKCYTYEPTSFVLDEFKKIPCRELNRSMYHQTYLKLEALRRSLDTHAEVHELSNYLHSKLEKESPLFVVVIDEFDGGLSPEYREIMSGIVKKLNAELNAILKDSIINYRLMVVTTEFSTVNALSTGKNVLWLQTKKFLTPDLLSYEEFQNLFMRNKDRMFADFKMRKSDVLRDCSKIGVDVDSTLAKFLTLD